MKLEPSAPPDTQEDRVEGKCSRFFRERENVKCMKQNPRAGGGGGGVVVLGLIFAVYVPLASQNLYPIIVHSVANFRPHFSHFWANVIFAIPT